MRIARAPVEVACAGLAAYSVAYASLLFLRPIEGAAFIAIADVVGALPPVFAGVFALLGSRQAVARTRWAWVLIGLGCLTWAAGEWTWTFYEVVLKQETPFPSLADVGYLGAVPLLLVGIVLLAAPSRGRAQVRAALDALAIVTAAGAISWRVLLHPIFEPSDSTLLEQVLSAAYPLTDLALLFALVVTLPRTGRGLRAVILGSLAAGVLCFLVADSVFVFQELDDTYATGSLADLGWAVGMGLIALAGYMNWHWQPDYRSRVRQGAALNWRQLIPLALLPPMIGWPLLGPAFGERWSFSLEFMPSAVLIVAYVVLVVMRQATSFLDTLDTNRRLYIANLKLEAKSEYLEDRLSEEQQAANRDLLTGVLSRRGVIIEAEKLLAPGKAHRPQVALGVIDLDSLKLVNDRFGHQAGDDVLRRVALTLSLSGAVVGRLGGDEFLVLLSDAHESEVKAFLTLAEWRLLTAADSHLSTFSAGFAYYPEDSVHFAALLSIADQRMYEAKRDKKAQLRLVA